VVHLDLDHDACYRAITLRDPRFDGRFFTAVKTTGVYCRPVCPARTPRPENVTFYPTAAAAQEAGFRPCLRCRPETAPDMDAWRGTSNTVSRALALIELGALDQGPVNALGSRLAWASVSCDASFDSILEHHRLRSPRRAGCCSPSNSYMKRTCR
jgi:AraC family transcriptional regulator of adaptative response / DNA-3-methyladenine glycosylase II